MNSIDSIKYFLPEMILVGTALFLLLYNTITSDKKALPYLAIWGLVVTFVSVLLLKNQNLYLFDGMVQLNGFTVFFKYLFLVASAVTVLFTIYHSRQSVEYYCLLMLSTLGLFILSSAADILMLYVGLETVSISSYLLTAIDKGNKKSSEAGLKYVIYGAMASGLMLFGMAYLYGVCGTTAFDQIKANLLLKTGLNPVVLMSSLLILVGLGYKIAAVPFHMWCPDVYEGAPTPITAFLSVAPKAAGFAIIIRFFAQTLGTTAEIPLLLAVVSAMTMTIGNLGALLQTNIKRLLAYSSIAHAGYMLMAVVLMRSDSGVPPQAGTESAIQAVLIYLAIYLFMNMGAFLVVILVSKVRNTEEIDGYNGLGWQMPFVGVLMTIFLFSLTGLPPLGGFIGKLYVFGAVINEHWYKLALIGVLNSALSLYYYVRVIKAIFLRGQPGTEQEGQSAIRNPQSALVVYPVILLCILVLPVVVFGVYWTPLVDFINRLVAVGT